MNPAISSSKNAIESSAAIPSQDKALNKAIESESNKATRSSVTAQLMPSPASENQSTAASANQNAATAASTAPGSGTPQVSGASAAPADSAPGVGTSQVSAASASSASTAPGAGAPQVSVASAAPANTTSGAGTAQTSVTSTSPAQSGSANSSENSQKESSPEQEQKAKARTLELFDQLQALVKEFYPKAQCSPSEGKLHFEYKTKEELGFYSNRPTKMPQAGGILGDITLRPGRYDKKLLSEQRDGFHTILTLAPFSPSTSTHILARVLFPSDVPPEFKERLMELVNKFGKD